jgi:hypothetical protein
MDQKKAVIQATTVKPETKETRTITRKPAIGQSPETAGTPATA